MENDKVTQQIKEADVWGIAIFVTVSVMVLEIILVSVLWRPLCGEIAITALEYGMEQVVKEYHPTLEERLEKPIAKYKLEYPDKTHAEAVEEIKRIARKMHPERMKELEANEE